MPGRDFAAQQHLFMCHIFQACGTAVQSPESGRGLGAVLSQVYVIKASYWSQLAGLSNLAQALGSFCVPCLFLPVGFCMGLCFVS